jgi:hypothetical protein
MSLASPLDSPEHRPVVCSSCGHAMLQALGVPRTAEEMERFFGIREACTQWECPRCFGKVFVGVDTRTVYPWRHPIGWGG